MGECVAKQLFRAWCVVTQWTGLSRLLGFGRDVVFAFVFGSGLVFDAFVLAFQIPNVMRRLFAEGAFSQALVPVYVEYQHKPSKEREAFLSSLLTVLLGVLCLVVLLGVLFSPWVIKLCAPGVANIADKWHLSSMLLRWTFPYLMCISLVAMLAAILNAHQRFSVAAGVAVVLNLVLIVASLAAHFMGGGMVWVARAVPLAGVIQLLIMVVALRSLMPLPKIRFRSIHPGVKKVLRLVLAGVYGVSVFQLGILLDNFLASFLPSGSLSALYFSQRLVQLPIGLCAASVVTVSMPHLARMLQEEDREGLSRTLGWGGQTLWLLGLPAAVALMLLASPILSTLFQYGAYDAHAVDMAAMSLRALAFGLPAFMFAKGLAAVFYAHQDMKTPVKWASLALLVNALSSIVFMQFWAHAGIAFGSALAAWFNVFGLYHAMGKKFGIKQFVLPRQRALHVVLAVCVMAGCLCFVPDAAVWSGLKPTLRMLWLALWVLGGLSVFIGVLFVLGRHQTIRAFYQSWTEFRS